LNNGYQKAERYHADLTQRVKSQLPRRESERRTHGLSRHSDILAAIETRLSLCSMTYNKFIESGEIESSVWVWNMAYEIIGICCFIPGRILDELFRVLNMVDAALANHNNPGQNNNAPTLPRSHELLQELRDISSMAMEYFDEKLAPNFREMLTRRFQPLPMSAELSQLLNEADEFCKIFWWILYDFGFSSNARKF